jgi:hypothetical protein
MLERVPQQFRELQEALSGAFGACRDGHRPFLIFRRTLSPGFAKLSLSKPSGSSIIALTSAREMAASDIHRRGERKLTRFIYSFLEV